MAYQAPEGARPLKPSDVIIAEGVAGWCKEHGVPEKDKHRPLRLFTGNGTGPRMLIVEMIPGEVLEERLRGKLRTFSGSSTRLLQDRRRSRRPSDESTRSGACYALVWFRFNNIAKIAACRLMRRREVIA